MMAQSHEVHVFFARVESFSSSKSVYSVTFEGALHSSLNLKAK
jgi:hypothetical protein